VSCGSFHSLLLTVSGSVYSWGSNIHGQLGHQHTAELVNLLLRIVANLKVHQPVQAISVLLKHFLCIYS